MDRPSERLLQQSEPGGGTKLLIDVKWIRGLEEKKFVHDSLRDTTAYCCIAR